ncbi:MAG: hypothetical protein J2P37_33100, partial [Ktedonobacteraceae bacterium]|nr:hypothetical protein [Ktedonobacteraceae bacterium]
MGHTILTSRGKTIHLLLDEQELWDPIRVGDYTRAYCHLHGSDHQRSLAIHRASGWGRCYSCGALVLMQAYHPALAKEVCAHAVQVLTPSSQEEGRTILPFRHQPSSSRRRLRSRRQPSWQEREHTTLRKTMPLLREACGNVSLADCWQALAYLETRGIPLPIARAAGVGYLPTSLLKEYSRLTPARFVLQRWVERLIFPLRSPDGTGFLGRTLWRWQLGMDEVTHQGLLEDEHEAP